MLAFLQLKDDGGPKSDFQRLKVPALLTAQAITYLHNLLLRLSKSKDESHQATVKTFASKNSKLIK